MYVIRASVLVCDVFRSKRPRSVIDSSLTESASHAREDLSEILLDVSGRGRRRFVQLTRHAH
jgi:hypothetical protein